MLWRHLCLARAWSAAGLLTCSMIGGPALGAEPEEPPPPAETRTVAILDAQKAGDLEVEARGHSQERVHLALKNKSTKRLNVVLPPGLVAASAPAQGAGGGRGLQSMGLGTPGNRPGSFGQFRAAGPEVGFRSVPVAGGRELPSVAVSPGQSVDLELPSVCLNFGLPNPTGRDRLTLKDVDDYTQDPRIRKALRSLSAYGTSQGVAQAVMWRVCDGLPFEQMAAQGGKLINAQELGLAARFVEALDSSNDGELVDPAYLKEGRVFVRVDGEGSLAKEARRLAGEVDGLHLLGLPVRAADARQLPAVSGPALLVGVVLTGTQKGETRGRIILSQRTAGGRWIQLGKANLVEGSTLSVLDGPGLARALDHAIASTFVAVKPARRVAGATLLKVENRLPFTVASVVLKTSSAAGSGPIPFGGLGIGPGRSALAPIQAAGGVVDRVVLNGL